MGTVEAADRDETVWLLEVGGRVHVEPYAVDELLFTMRVSLHLAEFAVELSQPVRIGALDQAVNELAAEVRRASNRWPRSVFH